MGLFDRLKEVNQRSGLSIALDLAAAVKQRLLTKDHGPRIEAPKEEHGPRIEAEEHGPLVVHYRGVFKDGRTFHGSSPLPLPPAFEFVPDDVEAVEEESPDVVASFEEIERRRGITWGARLDEAAARRDYRLALDRVRRVEWATKSRPAKFTRKTLEYWMDRGLCFRPAEKTGEIRNVKRRINFNPTTLKFLVRRTKQVQMRPAQRRPSADVYANWKWVDSRLVHMTDAEFFAHEMRLRQHEQRERDARRYTPPKRGGKKRDVVVAAPVVVEVAPVPQIEAVKSAPKVMSLGNVTSLEFLADEFDVSPDAVLKVAFDLGMRSVTPATEVDGETAEIIATEFGWTVKHAE